MAHTSFAQRADFKIGHGVTLPGGAIPFTNELTPVDGSGGGSIIKDPVLIEAKDAWMSLGFGIGNTKEQARNRAYLAAMYGLNMVLVTRAFEPEKTKHVDALAWKLARPGDYVHKIFPHDDGHEDATEISPTTNGKFVALTIISTPKFSLDIVREKAVVQK